MNTSINELKEIVFNGLKVKNLFINNTIIDRINYELSIIENKGFVDYFILYSRLIETCNQLNLLRSYGRGSAANSLVNYCLDITKIDPIAENLIFDRFICSKSKKFPDIDIDIPLGSKNKLLKAFKSKYPEYNFYKIVYLPNHDTDCEDIAP